jgi:hypothetical protein
MSSSTPDSVKAEIEGGKMKVGNTVADATGAAITIPAPLFVDANGAMATSLPTIFATGAANTGVAVMDIRGSATGTANDLMHLTLVAGANATATIAGYMRISVTDAAGVITTGAYYAPFYTLA